MLGFSICLDFVCLGDGFLVGFSILDYFGWGMLIGLTKLGRDDIRMSRFVGECSEWIPSLTKTLENGGWETILSFWGRPIFRGELLLQGGYTGTFCCS